MPATSVRIIDRLESMELRRMVLRPGLAPGSALPGDDQSGVIHLGAFDRSTLVSTCLILPEACPWLPGRPAWRLRSMATDPAVRGQGFGARVLAEADRVAVARGAEILWCNARQTAVDFYVRYGWQGHGDVFDTDLGPHLSMWRQLPVG